MLAARPELVKAASSASAAPTTRAKLPPAPAAAPRFRPQRFDSKRWRISGGVRRLSLPDLVPSTLSAAGRNGRWPTAPSSPPLAARISSAGVPPRKPKPSCRFLPVPRHRPEAPGRPRRDGWWAWSHAPADRISQGSRSRTLAALEPTDPLARVREVERSRAIASPRDDCKLHAVVWISVCLSAWFESFEVLPDARRVSGVVFALHAAKKLKSVLTFPNKTSIDRIPMKLPNKPALS